MYVTQVFLSFWSLNGCGSKPQEDAFITVVSGASVLCFRVRLEGTLLECFICVSKWFLRFGHVLTLHHSVPLQIATALSWNCSRSFCVASFWGRGALEGFRQSGKVMSFPPVGSSLVEFYEWCFPETHCFHLFSCNVFITEDSLSWESSDPKPVVWKPSPPTLHLRNVGIIWNSLTKVFWLFPCVSYEAQFSKIHMSWHSLSMCLLFELHGRC